MKIGAAAEELGITSSTIRFYERKGLIRPIGRISGRREVDEETLLTLRFLKLAKSAGFTLAEATRLLEIGFGEVREMDDWLEFLRDKRQAIRDQMADLRRMDSLLEKFQDCTCVDLQDCMSVPSASKLQEHKHD